MKIDPHLPVKRSRKRKRFADEDEELEHPPVPMPQRETEEETKFRQDVFYNLIDCVISGITERFKAAKYINNLFSFLWNYKNLEENKIRAAANNFVTHYKEDVSVELIEECVLLKTIHSANFSESFYSPIQLLNKIHELKLENLLPNVCISLRIFCTLPATVKDHSVSGI